MKILEGAQPCRINRDEPPVILGHPARPDDLDDVGRRKWDEMVALIEPMGTLSTAEGEALAIYCDAYSLRRRAKQSVTDLGLTVPGERGGRKANPALAVIRDCDSVMLRVIAEFGLTPSSRSRVKSKAEAPKDELGTFLSRRKV